MNKLPRWTQRLFIMGALALAAGPALAASPGPYYATPSWDQTLPASTRFIVLSNMNSEAVLDRETGLVWEQSPSTDFALDWFVASAHCAQLSKGGRKGWRLPTIQDLASLIDPTQSFPSLPIGHPFAVPPVSTYWSATNVANTGDSLAWVVGFINGDVDFFGKHSIDGQTWCVRGGQGVDTQ